MVQNVRNGRKFKLAQKWMKLGGDVSQPSYKRFNS